MPLETTNAGCFSRPAHLQVGNLLDLGVSREVKVLLGIDDPLCGSTDDTRREGEKGEDEMEEAQPKTKSI